MKETGLMFKAHLVRAILEGRKTQTRRVAKPVKHPDLGNLYTPGALAMGREPQHVIDRACPLGQPGDRIYVRETFSQHPEWGQLAFRADGEEFEDADGWLWEPKWKPAIHMPKALARIWLEVTGVRVERLQDISESDAQAEGCSIECMTPTGDDSGSAIYGPGGFAALWGSTTGRPELPANTNSKRYARVKHWLDTRLDTNGWDANPWVWVVDFKVLSTTGRPA